MSSPYVLIDDDKDGNDKRRRRRRRVAAFGFSCCSCAVLVATLGALALLITLPIVLSPPVANFRVRSCGGPLGVPTFTPCLDVYCNDTMEFVPCSGGVNNSLPLNVSVEGACAPSPIDIPCNNGLRHVVYYCSGSNTSYVCTTVGWVLLRFTAPALGDAVPEINSLALPSQVLNISGSTGTNPLFQLIWLAQNASVYYANETPDPFAAPLFDPLRVTATFTGVVPEIQEGAIFTHGYFSGPDTTVAPLLAAKQRIYHQACLSLIGFVGVPVCWNGTDYCTANYPLQLGGLNGTLAFSFSDVQSYVFAHSGLSDPAELLLDTRNGCWAWLGPLTTLARKRVLPSGTDIRTGVPAWYMVMGVTASGNATTALSFAGGFSATQAASFYTHNVDIDWGDGGEPEILKIGTAQVYEHQYAAPGNYTVRIAGNAMSLTHAGQPALQLKALNQWGRVFTYHMDFAGQVHSGLSLTPSDTPYGVVENLDHLFGGTTANAVTPTLNQFGSVIDTSAWVLPALTSMDRAFPGQTVSASFLSHSTQLARASHAFAASVLSALPPSLSVSGDASFMFYRGSWASAFNPPGVWTLGGNASNCFAGFTFTGAADFTHLAWATMMDATALFESATFSSVTPPTGWAPLTHALAVDAFFHLTHFTAVPNLSSLAFPAAQTASFALSQVNWTGATFPAWDVMFAGRPSGCRSLFAKSTLPTCEFSRFPLGTVVDANSMFAQLACVAPNYVQVDYFLNFTSAIDMSFAFSRINALGDMGQLYTPRVTSAVGLFLLTIMTGVNGTTDTSTWHFPEVVDASRMWQLVSVGQMGTAFAINASGWGFEKLVFATSLFNNVQIPTFFTVAGLNTRSMQTFDRAFANTQSVTGLIDVTGLNTSVVVTLALTFFGVDAQTVPGLGDWDTHNVHTLSNTFAIANTFSTNLFNVYNVTNWDVSAVSDMTNTFSATRAHLFSAPNVLHWNTAAALTLDGTFSMANRGEFNVSNWDVSNVLSMKQTFASAGHDDLSLFPPPQSGPVHPPIGAWNTANVRSMDQIFFDVGPGTSSADVSLWNTQSLQSAPQAFASTIYHYNVAAWDFSSLVTATNMFQNSNMDFDWSAKSVASIAAANGIINNCLMTRAHYDSFLTRFATTSTLNAVSPGGPRANTLVTPTNTPARVLQNYTAALPAHTTLSNAPRSWTLLDGGPQ